MKKYIVFKTYEIAAPVIVFESDDHNDAKSYKDIMCRNDNEHKYLLAEIISD